MWACVRVCVRARLSASSRTHGLCKCGQAGLPRMKRHINDDDAAHTCGALVARALSSALTDSQVQSIPFGLRRICRAMFPPGEESRRGKSNSPRHLTYSQEVCR